MDVSGGEVLQVGDQVRKEKSLAEQVLTFRTGRYLRIKSPLASAFLPNLHQKEVHIGSGCNTLDPHLTHLAQSTSGSPDWAIAVEELLEE